jgi:hypothetical protein
MLCGRGSGGQKDELFAKESIAKVKVTAQPTMSERSSGEGQRSDIQL